MPRARKPTAVHQLQNTYQPCRHAERRDSAASNRQRRVIPAWLPDDVKVIYRKLAERLPPLDSIDETTLAQLALLKHQLQTDPDGFRVQQHSQLRQLTATVRQWVAALDDDDKAAGQTESLDDWMKRRSRMKKQYPVIVD
ncbi:hypothetical protein [Endozoicomonas sp. ALD040]|uniref:hypothetical protein n=1 Tax=Endozoicomonas sp. ALD040 TaxID=3403079 RepID=UPI003BAFD5C0